MFFNLVLLSLPWIFITMPSAEEAERKWIAAVGNVSLGDTLDELLLKRPEAVADSLDGNGAVERTAANQELRELRSDFPASRIQFMALYSIRNSVVVDVTLSFIGKPEDLDLHVKSFCAALVKLLGESYTISSLEAGGRRNAPSNIALRWSLQDLVVIATFPPTQEKGDSQLQAFVVRKFNTEKESKAKLLKPVENPQNILARIQALQLRPQWLKSEDLPTDKAPNQELIQRHWENQGETQEIQGQTTNRVE